ncbi:MAG: M20/M25/M40 family metallo-hydrolase [Oscillospiraceae bacterium]|nr:M20/M25/M40 family metallo-hydrolase [Oscillospiraceae bacterium]
MEVDREYINYLLSYIGEAGNRIAFSSEETEAKIRLIEEMLKLNLDVRTDEAGNIYGIMYAKNEDKSNDTPLKVIGVGSHIDSVPSGGNYDGLVGITCGMAAVKSLQESNCELKENVAVMALACEESSVFGKSCLGSKYIANKLSLKELRDIQIVSDSFDDGKGNTYGEKLDECNKVINILPLDREIVYSVFLEVHIEQGPILAESDNKIGIVTAIAAPIRTKFTLVGNGGHDGTTPMEQRRDALVRI